MMRMVILLTGIQLSEIIKRIDTGGMTIGPLELDAVPADVLPAAQFKTCRQVILRRRPGADENVAFALARGTRTGAAQNFQVKIIFPAVVPNDGKGALDDLNIFWRHENDYGPATIDWKRASLRNAVNCWSLRARSRIAGLI